MTDRRTCAQIDTDSLKRFSLNPLTLLPISECYPPGLLLRLPAGVKGWSAANLFIQSNFLCRWQADMISVRESHRRQRTRVFTRAGPRSYLISARLLSASDAVLLRRQGDGVRGLYVIWTSDLRGETFYFRKGKSRQEYQSVFKWFNSSSVQLSSGGGPSRMNRQWERPTILPESWQRKSCIILPIPFTPSLFSPPLPHTPLFSPLTPLPPQPSPVSKMDLHGRLSKWRAPPTCPTR